MSATPEALVQQLSSADDNERAAALAQLVLRGLECAPALRTAMTSPDVEVRAQAAQALAEIGDPASAELFAAAIGDADERVRGRGAQGLARIGDSRALDALVRTIDDLPDILHNPYTLSLYALTGFGVPALTALAPLLKAPHPLTRARAFLAIREIAAKIADRDALARALGDYDPNAPQADRDRAADRWSVWIAKQ